MDTQKNLKKNDLCSHNPILEGTIWKQLLIYFFPIVFGTMFQQLYNTVDTIIVGRFLGKLALSAVGGSSGMLISLVVGFFVGLSSGASVLVSQYYGAKDPANVSKATHTVLVFSVLCGVLITAAGFLWAPLFLEWMKVPENTMELSVLYLRVYCSGMVGNMIYNVGSAILRAAGDSRNPTIALIVCCIINIVLDIIFVIPMGMGVFGAALATIIAQGISAVMVLIVMHRTRDCYRFEFRLLRMDSGILGPMIRIGLPAGIMAVMYGLSNIVIQVGVNGLGTDAVAAWAAYYRIDGFFWMVVNAFGIAICTFVGQNYGAGLYKRVYQSIRSCIGMTTVFTIAMTSFVYLCAPLLLQIFITDAGVQAEGVMMMRYLTPYYILYVNIEILNGALRGAGDTIVPMFISVIGVCAIRSAWIIFVLPLHNNEITMMLSYPISWGITTVAYIVYTLFFSKLRIRGAGKILR